MTVAELLALAANRADAWNTLWQLYIGVSTAALALVVASSKPLSRLASMIICLAFLGFLWGNYSAFSDYHDVRQAIGTVLEKNLLNEHGGKLVITQGSKEHEIANEVNNEFVKTLITKIGPSEEKKFKAYYFLIAAIVLLAIIIIPFARRRQEKKMIKNT